MALSGCHTKLYKRYASCEPSYEAVRYCFVYCDNILFFVSVAGAHHLDYYLAIVGQK